MCGSDDARGDSGTGAVRIVEEYVPDPGAGLLPADVLDLLPLEQGEGRGQIMAGKSHVVDDAGLELAFRTVADDVQYRSIAGVQPRAVEIKVRT